MTYDYDVPGTVHLVDIQGVMDVKKGNGNIVLRPQPSSDVNDPLRWSNRKKRLQFALLWLWAFLLAVSVNFSGPFYTEWTKYFDVSFGQLNICNALTLLFLGVGVVFFQPLGMKVGRRFVYIMCTVLVIVAMAVGSKAEHIGSIWASNVLSGLAASPVDTLVEISATDVFFLHERSTIFSFLVLSLYVGSNLGSMVAGFIGTSMGWRWCYYFQIIFFAVLFVIVLFVLEDTSFRRLPEDGEARDIVTSTVTSRIQEDEEKQREIDNLREAAQNSDPSAVAAKNPKLAAEIEVSSMEESTLSGNTLRPYSQRMKIVHTQQNDPRNYLTLLYRPFLLVTFPAAVWGGLVYGAQIMWLSLIGVTQSRFLAAPPYNFNLLSVGLSNLAPCIGAILGMFYGGKFVDWLTVRIAKRNLGYMEPEFRLWAMIVPLVLNAAGLLGWGLGGAYEAKWPVLMVTGLALMGFSMSSSGPICITYVVDSYEKMGPECLVLMLFIRNMIGTGFTFAIGPWLARDGVKLTTWLMFMLSLVINGGFVVFLIWGKSFRKMTRARYERWSDPDFRLFGSI